MNLYWGVYQSLEEETLNLADNILFSDNQTEVCSLKIADLIVRCAVEIESISKKLYQDNGGNMNARELHEKSDTLYFDSDCIQYLDKKWHITKKVVNVVNQKFNFEKEENLTLRPLKNCNKQGDGRWKKAYNELNTTDIIHCIVGILLI